MVVARALNRPGRSHPHQVFQTCPHLLIVPGSFYQAPCLLETSLLAQTVEGLPAIEETQAQPLGWEDSPGEGKGNPPQCSCLENSMDTGDSWATVHGVTESLT